MNVLLSLGLLLIIGYTSGWLLEKIGLPKIIGYIGTGILFSPNTIGLIDYNIGETTKPLMDVCLAFIAFEVGGALKWSKIRKHEKEIINITILASIFPFLLITLGVFAFGLLFPAILPFEPLNLLLLALLLGALASPTAPAATLSVIHQYKAKGNVTDTILGVAALDDIFGILLFSFTKGIISILTSNAEELFSTIILNTFYEITVAILIGASIAIIMNKITNLLQISKEGQWFIIIFSLLILCVGIAQLLNIDSLLVCITMGIVVVNKCEHQKLIFRILERYTENFIFLFFFVLSGLHLNISTIPKVSLIIFIFIILRTAGKFLGANIGARIAKAGSSVQKYTAGGLLPQAGIVIGLALSVYQKNGFTEISEILLTIIMGATIIHELIGPIAAKYSLKKSGEIKNTNHNKNKVH